jgi:hypothetical protein
MIAQKLAARAAAIILAGLMVFQFLLVAGYPLGSAAWGGYFTELPVGLRIASLVSTAIYGALILVALARAGIVETPFGARFGRSALWAITALFFLGSLMNLASQSFWERAIMTPLAFILTACFYILARHPRNP